MLIYAVDDSSLAIKALEKAIRAAAPEAEVHTFGRVDMILAALTEKPGPDVIFVDIEMPGMTGLELAGRAREISPETEIVFVSGTERYAMEAYQLHVRGYILKPATPERIREELDLIAPIRARRAHERRLRVQCFGNFGVFHEDRPVVFARRKTKEMFAYLIDRNGSTCGAEEIVSALWEDESDPNRKKSYLRAMTTDMRRTLSALGLEDVLVREHSQWAVRRDLVDCDYFRMLDGDMSAVNAYHGEYMKQYSWAELTISKLQFSEE